MVRGCASKLRFDRGKNLLVMRAELYAEVQRQCIWRKHTCWSTAEVKLVSAG